MLGYPIYDRRTNSKPNKKLRKTLAKTNIKPKLQMKYELNTRLEQAQIDPITQYNLFLSFFSTQIDNKRTQCFYSSATGSPQQIRAPTSTTSKQPPRFTSAAPRTRTCGRRTTSPRSYISSSRTQTPGIEEVSKQGRSRTGRHPTQLGNCCSPRARNYGVPRKE